MDGAPLSGSFVLEEAPGGAWRVVRDGREYYTLGVDRQKNVVQFVSSPADWYDWIYMKRYPLDGQRVPTSALVDLLSNKSYTKSDLYRHFHRSIHDSVLAYVFASFYTKCVLVVAILFVVNAALTTYITDVLLCSAPITPDQDDFTSLFKVDLGSQHAYASWINEMQQEKVESHEDRHAVSMMRMVELGASGGCGRRLASLRMPSNIRCGGGNTYITRVYALYLHVVKSVWMAHFLKLKVFQEIVYTSPQELSSIRNPKVDRLLDRSGIKKDQSAFYYMMYRLIVWEYGPEYFDHHQLRKVHDWLERMPPFNAMVTLGGHASGYSNLFGALLLIHAFTSRLIEPAYWIRMLLNLVVKNHGVYEVYASPMIDTPIMKMKHTIYSAVAKLSRPY